MFLSLAVTIWSLSRQVDRYVVDCWSTLGRERTDDARPTLGRHFTDTCSKLTPNDRQSDILDRVSSFDFSVYLFKITDCRSFSILKILTPEGYSSEFSVGVCRPVPQIQTRFQTKTCHLPHPFSDLASKIRPYPFLDLCCTIIKLRISNKVKNW